MSVAKSCPTLCNPWTVAHQAALSVGFSRKEYRRGLPFLLRGLQAFIWIIFTSVIRYCSHCLPRAIFTSAVAAVFGSQTLMTSATQPWGHFHTPLGYFSTLSLHVPFLSRAPPPSPLSTLFPHLYLLPSLSLFYKWMKNNWS